MWCRVCSKWSIFYYPFLETLKKSLNIYDQIFISHCECSKWLFLGDFFFFLVSQAHPPPPFSSSSLFFLILFFPFCSNTEREREIRETKRDSLRVRPSWERESKSLRDACSGPMGHSSTLVKSGSWDFLRFCLNILG